MVDLWRDFWIRETGTGQQMAHLRERYMMMMKSTNRPAESVMTIAVCWVYTAQSLINLPTFRGNLPFPLFYNKLHGVTVQKMVNFPLISTVHFDSLSLVNTTFSWCSVKTHQLRISPSHCRLSSYLSCRVCLSVYLPACLSVCLSVRLSARLSVCVSMSALPMSVRVITWSVATRRNPLVLVHRSFEGLRGVYPLIAVTSACPTTSQVTATSML